MRRLSGFALPINLMLGAPERLGEDPEIQTRSFCYGDDMVDALVRLMATRDEFSGPVNLGNPDEYTILDLAKKVVALTKSRSKIVFKRLPSDDPLQRQPNIAPAKNHLKWQPSTKLEDGLRGTIAYFKGPKGNLKRP